MDALQRHMEEHLSTSMNKISNLGGRRSQKGILFPLWDVTYEKSLDASISQTPETSPYLLPSNWTAWNRKKAIRFIDESGFTYNMPLTQGYALKSQGSYDKVHWGKG